MSNILLNVPYEEKDQAKKLGAKWDSRAKTWYIPAGLSPDLFTQWLTEAVEPAQQLIAKDQIALLRGMTNCWRCKGIITVYALATHLLFDGEREWPEGFYILSMLQQLPEHLARFIQLRCPLFKMGKQDNQGARFYRNHCDHCKSGISELKLHAAGGIFNPQVKARSKLELIYLPLEGSWQIAGKFYDYSQQALLLASLERRFYLTDLL